MASSSEEVKAEIGALRAKYDKNCRVIENVGDFKYIVTIKLQAPEVTFKFQLDNSYPQNPPQIIATSSKIKQETLGELTNDLQDKAKSLSGDESGLVEKLLKEAADWLAEKSPVTDREEEEESKEKTKKRPKGKGKKKKGKANKEEEDETFHKKPSMKTATDVVSRIMWDDSLNKDDFSIGYIDRFRGLLEKSFASFSWEDLASVDYDVLAIPKHRIQYFKYKDVKVWDKAARCDYVFGSSGERRLTIQELIERYEEEKARQAVEENSAEKANANDPDQDSYDSDSESDDGITVTVGGATNDEVNFFDEDGDSDNYSSEPWGNKLRPNYFIAVRITDNDVTDMVSHIQDVLVEREPRYQECCIGPKALHVTICTLRIDSHEQMDNAVDLLRAASHDFKLASKGVKLKFEGLDNFFHRVLYTKVHHGDDFKNFVDEVKLALRTGGIEIRDNYDFVPHMTVMKVSRPVARAMGTKVISPHIYENSEDIVFGEQGVDGIHLCSMKEEKRSDGFYTCPLSLNF